MKRFSWLDFDRIRAAWAIIRRPNARAGILENGLKQPDDLGEALKPDMVVTHWPLDTHPNHHVISSLVWRCSRCKGGWNLYFFEVMTDQQTLAFAPALFLDIASVREVKRRALMGHRNQEPLAIRETHERMHRRRGAECGVEFAEAYRLVEAKEGCPPLPVVFLRMIGTEPSEKSSESQPGGRRP